MSNIWLTTDTHFNHERLIQYGRPKDFDVRIRKNLVAMVKKDDVLIHLGDFCMARTYINHKWFREHVPGRHILVIGNHDTKSTSWYMEHGWDFVCYMFSDRFYGKKVVFSHMPLPKVSGAHVNIHGHWHNNGHRAKESMGFYDLNYHRLLALEHTDYKPVSLEKWLQLPSILTTRSGEYADASHIVEMTAPKQNAVNIA